MKVNPLDITKDNLIEKILEQQANLSKEISKLGQKLVAHRDSNVFYRLFNYFDNRSNEEKVYQYSKQNKLLGELCQYVASVKESPDSQKTKAMEIKVATLYAKYWDRPIVVDGHMRKLCERAQEFKQFPSKDLMTRAFAYLATCSLLGQSAFPQSKSSSITTIPSSFNDEKRTVKRTVISSITRRTQEKKASNTSYLSRAGESLCSFYTLFGTLKKKTLPSPKNHSTGLCAR
jgi:hypothetical protein